MGTPRCTLLDGCSQHGELIGFPMKAKILLSAFLIPLCLSAAPRGMVEYKAYQEGVYSTTALINKHLREGLQETVLDQYASKYLVVANLDKMSFVDIIFYENISEKQQILDVRTAKKVNTGENFMVFGAFERKADASMIQERLGENGLETEVIYNSEAKNMYVQNPLIVKKYLSDIRELIKDMPVRVVKVEKTILKDGSDQKCQPSALLSQKLESLPNLSIQEEFSKLEDQWIKGGETGNKASNYIAIKRTGGFLIGKKNYYVIGEKIGCFLLKNIIHNDYAKTDSIILMGPDLREYVATKPSNFYRIEKASITPKKVYAKKVVPIQKTKKKTCTTGNPTLDGGFCPDEADATAKQTNTTANDYQCDFGKISLVKIGDKSKKTSSTSYSGIENVIIIKKDSSYVSVKSAGKPEVSIPSATFSSKCSSGAL